MKQKDNPLKSYLTYITEKLWGLAKKKKKNTKIDIKFLTSPSVPRTKLFHRPKPLSIKKSLVILKDNKTASNKFQQRDALHSNKSLYLRLNLPEFKFWLHLLPTVGFGIFTTLTVLQRKKKFKYLEKYKTLSESQKASQVVLVVKNPPANVRDRQYGFNPWVKKIPWRRA